MSVPPTGTIELLAPAGSPEAAYAGLQHGADAVYLGLKRFSARADAENFDLGQVAELVSYAHGAFTPARRVYVTLNTVLLEAELPEMAETLANLELIGADALIVQDLGLCQLARRHFPSLRLHASTQLAIHSVAGAAQLRRLGIGRVVLARELTLPEIGAVAALPGLEVEVFLHGALCYAYSGLCLLSSHLRGASGNRGACAYLCRNSFRCDGSPESRALMSMKDLALADAVPDLRRLGVRSLKIEGRKKSPLYVAAVTSYYRALLDGALTAERRRELEHDVKTVFSRPWTPFHVRTPHQAGVTDTETVGHRGAPVGVVEAVLHGPPELLVFTVRERALERYDGLQLDLQDREKPFGFSVEEIRLWPARGRPDRRSVFEAMPGTRVAVPLPPRHPRLPVGATLYCGSSQAVKRSYRWSIPRPGTHGLRLPVEFSVEVGDTELCATARLRVHGRDLTPVVARLPDAEAAETARDAAAVAEAARQAFAKLGGTPFTCAAVSVANPAGRFVRVAEFNDLRRRVVEALQNALADELAARARQAMAPLPGPRPAPAAEVTWEIAVDRPEYLSGLQGAALTAVSEVALYFDRLTDAELSLGLAQLNERLGADRIRLALPTIVRPWQEATLRERLERLRQAGYQRWEVANLAGLSYLADTPGLDLAAGWPLYVLNRFSAAALTELGFNSVTLSPEDGRDNLAALLPALGGSARVIVYQDTPLALSAVCAFASARGCTGKRQECPAGTLQLESRHGDRLLVINDRCQSVVLNAEALSWSQHVAELAELGARRLRAEFAWRAYDAATVAALWERLRRGERLERTHEANWQRGLAATAPAQAEPARR